MVAEVYDDGGAPRVVLVGANVLDAIFIARAREDVAYLLARVRELEASVKNWEKLAFAEGYELRMPWKGTDDYSDWVMTEGVEVPETEGDGE